MHGSTLHMCLSLSLIHILALVVVLFCDLVTQQSKCCGALVVEQKFAHSLLGLAQQINPPVTGNHELPARPPPYHSHSGSLPSSALRDFKGSLKETGKIIVHEDIFCCLKEASTQEKPGGAQRI